MAGKIAFFDELTESFSFLSYEAHPGFVIYNIHDAQLTHKIAAFDFDSTLVRPKESRPFPKDISDWEWLYPTVPETLKMYSSRGYAIVLFTNQSKLWKHTQIITALATLEIGAFIVVAMEKELYKPNPAIANVLFDGIHINRKKSFFVGDALGGSNFSDSDALFANAINFTCYSPEQMFYEKASTDDINNAIYSQVPIINEQCVIIMVGYPGSGKSTIANAIYSRENDRYRIVEKDVLKTKAKVTLAIHKAINDGKSPIIDETNPSIESREGYIAIAKSHNLPVIIIHAAKSFDESYNQNKSRDESKQVPKIVYYKYRKAFIEPSLQEINDLSMHEWNRIIVIA
jgi:bifunctional polynucleotide phosphatase/kinase